MSCQINKLTLCLVPGASVRFNKTQTVSNARSYVQEGFSTLFHQKHIDSSHQANGSVDMILRRKDVHIIRKGKEKEIKMNYDNYEAKIVERYGVALVGYPCRLVNPANLGRTDLEKVVAAFKDGTCRWEKLSTSCKNSFLFFSYYHIVVLVLGRSTCIRSQY